MNRSKTILLVEDNMSDADLARRAFKKANVMNPLVHVEDGQDALDYLFCEGQYAGRDINDLPSLVLLDLKLPRVDGLEVLKQLRKHPVTHRLLVVILTSSKEEQDVASSYDLGVNSYIRKPVDFNQFADVVAQMGLYWLMINESPNQTV